MPPRVWHPVYLKIPVEKDMARKKTETISLRVNPLAKNLLEGISAFRGETATEIVEKLITDAAKQMLVDKLGAAAGPGFTHIHDMDLYTVICSAYVENDPVLTRLRIFYLAPELVTDRDKSIISTILDSPDIFSGKDLIYNVEDPSSTESQAYNKFVKQEIPELDLKSIRDRWESLEEYVLFKSKNKNLNSSFAAYLKLTGRG
jgi:hypothetical protein